MNSHFLPMFRRPLGGEYRWCAEWWRHAEAITRLTALWHAWEALRLQPGTGMATWLRDHLDHQLPVLLGRTGPFAMCSEDEHIDPRQARTKQPPPGWWDLPQPRRAPAAIRMNPQPHRRKVNRDEPAPCPPDRRNRHVRRRRTPRLPEPR